MIIEIVGTREEPTAYDEGVIRAVLRGGSTGLEHGGEYTGRPATQIFAAPQAIIKLRTEVRLARDTARLWTQNRLEEERRLGVHHPGKTWFLLCSEEEDAAQIGSICPRLAPLHCVLKDSPSDEACGERWVRWLAALYAMNFRVAAASGRSLDEGLSNFGVAEDGRLHYLDDDLYSWDRFATTAQMIGTVVRSLSWLSPSHGRQLGGALRQAILESFGHSDGPVSLVEQLRDVYVPSPDRQAVLEAVQDGLIVRAASRKKAAAEAGEPLEPLALLADIHANLPALDSVLARLHALGVRQGIVLGDVVGYGPHPRQCIERLRRSNFLVLKGNHDDAVVGGEVQSGMTSHARWSWEWTRAQLNEQDRRWLQDLPPVVHGGLWMAVHGAPVDPSFFHAYVYHMTFEDNLDILQRRGVPLCFHGHTHMPGVYGRHPKRGDVRSEESSQALGEYTHCLVCPGSVGQPRDGRTAAQFGLYDPARGHLALHTVAYEVEHTVADMLAAGFPATLVARLQEGR